MVSRLAWNFRFFATWARTTGSGWAKVHHYRYWRLVMDLVTSSWVSLHLSRMILYSIINIFGQIFSSSDSRSILNRSILLVIIAKFKTASVWVFTAAITINFMLTGRSLVCHWHVVLPLNSAPDGRNIFHLRICIRAAEFIVMLSWRRILRTLTINDRLQVIRVLVVVFLVNFAQPAIESVLMMLGYRLVYLCFVAIGRFQAFGNVLTVPTVVCSINLVFLAPPLWVNYGIQARWTSSLLSSVMWIVDLKSLLGAVPWDSTGYLLWSFTSPGWGCLLHDIHITMLERVSNMSSIVCGLPLWLFRLMIASLLG